MKVALVVGHNENSQGAVNDDSGVTEFQFNKKLANRIELEFPDHNMTDRIEIVYRTTNYQDLPNQINDLNPDLIVSLHANAFNGEAYGCEMLYYHKSEKGKTIAQIFQDKLIDLLQSKDRGVKPRSSEDRGGYLLRYTNAPCIICEPFFIDENMDYDAANSFLKTGELVTSYCEAINEAVQFLRA